MKFIIIFIASLTVAAQAASVSNLLFSTEWLMFKAEHGKTYENRHEEEYRLEVYMNNSRFIEEHNKRYAEGKVLYELGMNQFGDMHIHEFKQKMLMENVKMNETRGAVHKLCQKQSPYDTSMTQVDNLNWVKEGAVTPVRSQSPCGSCWAFSTVGTLEGHHYRKTGKLVSLSEQNLIDCSTDYGNGGCDGGWPENALMYVIDNGGINTRKSYPYKGVASRKCHYNPNYVGETITGCRMLPPNDEEQLKIAVQKEGPIAVAMIAGINSFMFYKSGIFHTDKCNHRHLDHAVTLVGFGAEGGEDYWLGKNSWDVSWGEKGYFRIARNAGNLCGIASVSVFPVTD